MFLLIAGTILLLLLYCFLRNSETASVLHHQSVPYSRALFDYDQQFIVYNENELEVDSTTHSLRSFGEYSTNRNDCILFFPLEYDYPTIRYPIPFSQYYQHEENRYRNYGIQQPILGRMKTGAITPSTDPSAIMLVIGSDTKQFYSMLKTIEQASRVFNLSALTIIDYGFSDTDIKRLRRVFSVFLSIAFHLLSCIQFRFLPNMDFHGRMRNKRGILMESHQLPRCNLPMERGDSLVRYRSYDKRTIPERFELCQGGRILFSKVI